MENEDAVGWDESKLECIRQNRLLPSNLYFTNPRHPFLKMFQDSFALHGPRAQSTGFDIAQGLAQNRRLADVDKIFVLVVGEGVQVSGYEFFEVGFEGWGGIERVDAVLCIS